MEQHHYPVDVTWESGKEGRASSSDGLPAITVASPPEFGGPGGLWSPEHLFVGALASCYMTTYLAIAERSRLEVAGLAVPAEGRLVQGEDRRFSIDRVVLRPVIRIRVEADREKAERIAHKSEEVCLITRSVRSEVVLEATIEVG